MTETAGWQKLSQRKLTGIFLMSPLHLSLGLFLIAALFHPAHAQSTKPTPAPAPASPSNKASEAALSQKLLSDLAKALGTCYGQQITLKQLRKRFPDLELKATMAEIKWNNAFKEAEEAIEARVDKLNPGTWKKLREQMIDTATPLLEKENRKATAETAQQYLVDMVQRAEGTLDFPYRSMLLASHPQYRKSPALEFSKGYIQVFSTKDHAKSPDMELTVRLPLSWKPAESDRPHIVQKWTSEAGHGLDMAMLLVRKMPMPTQEEEEAFFTAENAKDMLGLEGEILGFSVGKLEGMPLGILHFKDTRQRLDVTLSSRSVCYYLLVKDTIVLFQFGTYGHGDSQPEDREARMKLLEPLIKSIMNSVVLVSHWETPPGQGR